MKLVIVGYGPGGVSAAVTAKTFARDVEITILAEETLPAYRKPGAILGFETSFVEELAISDWSPESLIKKGIEVQLGKKVVAGDSKTKTLLVQNANEKTETISYDKLILATGGTPSLPALPGIDLDGVYTIRDLTDAFRIGTVLDEIESVVIVGAGFTALETAERMISHKKETHLIVRSRLLRSLLEPVLSEELRDRLPPTLNLHCGCTPERILGEEHVEKVIVKDTEIDTNAVFLLTGVKPNVSIARSLGVDIGSLGGIIVNERMETSVKDIYAVGDCVEIRDFLTGKPILMPTASTAARGGRQAGVAAIGKDKIYPDVSLRFQYDYLFGTEIVCVGESSTIASEFGIPSEIHYFDDPAEYSRVALVTDKSGKIIGGQVLSARMAAKIGFQIYHRVSNGANISESPLPKSPYVALKELLERTLGPIN